MDGIGVIGRVSVSSGTRDGDAVFFCGDEGVKVLSGVEGFEGVHSVAFGLFCFSGKGRFLYGWDAEDVGLLFGMGRL